MVADDACSAIKSDLKAGTYTHYTKSFPIYIQGNEPYEGGDVHITLKDPRREPVQTVSGSVLYTKRSCTVIIVATSQTNRDNLYLDVVDILTATNRGYKLKRAKDDHFNPVLNGLPLEVSMLL